MIFLSSKNVVFHSFVVTVFYFFKYTLAIYSKLMYDVAILF